MPTTPPATTAMATVNVCLDGPPPTAPYPVVQDASVRSALRPAPAQPTSSVTDLLGTVFVKVEEMTVNKTHPSGRGV